MKKLLAVYVIAISIIACSSNSDGFRINGKITGELADSTTVYLKTTDSTNKFVDVDTTITIGGEFQFTGTQDAPVMHYLVIDGIRGNLPVVLENGTITFNGQRDSLAFSNAEGTLQNDIFAEFLAEQRKNQEMVQSMQGDLQKASQAKDTATINSLREEYFELQENAKESTLTFVKNNPNALISAFVLENLLRTKAIPSSEVKELYNPFTDEIKESAPGKRIAKELEKMAATAVGSTAPSFSGPTPTGDLLALNDAKGKLTLIDFWAGWCKPCRAENPNIVAVYEKYKDKGLNIVGVSLDKKSEDWVGAIEADGLEWNHISNLEYFNDPIAKLYGVNSIPAAFLLDENGVIVAKNLRGAELEEKVAEYLLN